MQDGDNFEFETISYFIVIIKGDFPKELSVFDSLLKQF